MGELKRYFIVYATEYTTQIYNTIEYYSSVEELLKEYYRSNYTLINFWRIGDVEDDR